jgi:hypothetical protein
MMAYRYVSRSAPVFAASVATQLRQEKGVIAWRLPLYWTADTLPEYPAFDFLRGIPAFDKRGIGLLA